VANPCGRFGGHTGQIAQAPAISQCQGVGWQMLRGLEVRLRPLTPHPTKTWSPGKCIPHRKMHTSHICSLLIAAMLSVWSSSVRGDPIDCASAAAADELAICRSEDLRTMDGELDRAYRAARVRWTASMSNSVKVMQEEWIKERRKCGEDPKCLMERIVEQIIALDKMRPDSPTWLLEKAKPPR
jgi:uncharacterized protein YecT (DUF1311 family)